MKRVAKKSLFLVVLAALTSAGALAAEPSHFDNFITRQGAQLMDDRAFTPAAKEAAH